METLAFPYDPKSGTGLVGIVAGIFVKPQASGNGLREIILDETGITIPGTLFNNKTLQIPYEDVFNLTAFDRARKGIAALKGPYRQIIIRYIGGSVSIQGDSLQPDHFDHLFQVLQTRIKSAGGGELGLF